MEIIQMYYNQQESSLCGTYIRIDIDQQNRIEVQKNKPLYLWSIDIQ